MKKMTKTESYMGPREINAVTVDPSQICLVIPYFHGYSDELLTFPNEWSILDSLKCTIDIRYAK